MPKPFIAELISNYDDTLQQAIRGIIRKRFYSGNLHPEGIMGFIREIDGFVADSGDNGSGITIGQEGETALNNYFGGKGVTLKTIFFRHFSRVGRTGAQEG